MPNLPNPPTSTSSFAPQRPWPWLMAVVLAVGAFSALAPRYAAAGVLVTPLAAALVVALGAAALMGWRALPAVAVEKQLARAGISAEFKQFVRGKSAVSEIVELAESTDVSLVIVGLRKRSAVGKLILGSVSRDILLSVPCPVLAVKASQ